MMVYVPETFHVDGGIASDGHTPVPRLDVMSFQAVEWWELRGKGWVANIAGIEGFNPRPLVGQQVEIDGKDYSVLGVETFCLLDRGVVGLPFGLLVGER